MRRRMKSTRRLNADWRRCGSGWRIRISLVEMWVGLEDTYSIGGDVDQVVLRRSLVVVDASQGCGSN